MSDRFLSWKKRASRLSNLTLKKLRFKGVRITKLNILAFIILVLLARLFFSIYFSENAYAKQKKSIEEISPEVIDPIKKVKSVQEKNKKKTPEPEKVCGVSDKKEPRINAEKIKEDEREEKYQKLIEGYPMEEMIPFILKKEEKVAAFLIAIAKKESDWGKHVPTKGGRDCYNYWGYKGGYKLTDSGYSCFDSPEQAIEVVGGRIGELNDKGHDTPERMVIWKCGSSCSWDRPEAVKSWIGAVRTYWQKLLS